MQSTARSIACRSRDMPVPTTPSSCSRARPLPSRSCGAKSWRRSQAWCAPHREQLACAIADDGEGATHFITIDVEGCESFDDARSIARAVADSPLVKTAIHGADPNWGRIVSAAGYAGVSFAEEDLSLSINEVPVYRRWSSRRIRRRGAVEFDQRAIATCHCACGSSRAPSRCDSGPAT